LGVIVAAVITSLGTVIAAWLQIRHAARAGVLGTAQNENGGRAQPLTPTPSTMGREFDRHHLPRWRPEPPFLPGRIAVPVEAAGARSGLPILQQSQAGAEQREGQGTAGGSRGWGSSEAATRERCAELLGVDLDTVRELAVKVEPYVRADGTRIWSLTQLERQLGPEAYGRRRGGYVDRRRTLTVGAGER